MRNPDAFRHPPGRDEGVWQGRRVSCERTCSNECVKSASTTSVFTF
ncbi:hypothetical protein [Streptomyces sp. NPDC087787]